MAGHSSWPAIAPSQPQGHKEKCYSVWVVSAFGYCSFASVMPTKCPPVYPADVKKREGDCSGDETQNNCPAQRWPASVSSHGGQDFPSPQYEPS